MIRNGVIDAQKDFAQRRYLAEAGRNFEKLKLEVAKKSGVDIECCREAYFKAGEEIFAMVGDVLVDTYSTPTRIEPWEEFKKQMGPSA